MWRYLKPFLRTRLSPKAAGVFNSSSMRKFFLLIVYNSYEQLGTPDEVGNSFRSPKFKRYFKEHVFPLISNFEEKRIKTLTKLRSRALKAIMATIAIVLLWIAISILYELNAVNFHPYEANGLLIFLLICVVIWVALPVGRFKLKVKQEVFPKIFKFFGDDFVYSEDCPITIDEFEKSRLVPGHTESKSWLEDYIQGTYKNISLELFEAHLYKSAGKNRRRLIFSGLFIIFNMHKPFNGQTVVKCDKGKAFNWLTDKTTQRKLESVRLEDPVFDEVFEVYSSDQVEARYLLTTSFMQRLLDLSTFFGDADIECSFYDNQVLFKIPSKENKFEPASIFKGTTFEEDANMILEEMVLLFKMIEMLKLHENTRL